MQNECVYLCTSNSAHEIPNIIIQIYRSLKEFQVRQTSMVNKASFLLFHLKSSIVHQKNLYLFSGSGGGDRE